MLELEVSGIEYRLTELNDSVQRRLPQERNQRSTDSYWHKIRIGTSQSDQ